MAKLTDKQTIALLDPTQALLTSTLGGSLAEKRVAIIKAANDRTAEITAIL